MTIVQSLRRIQTIKELLRVLLLGIDDNSSRERILERTILKLVLIVEANYIDFPMKGAWHGIKMKNHLMGASCYSYFGNWNW